jgi:FkbM family methyltransferase
MPTLRKWLSGRMPTLAGLYHSYRHARALARHPARTTPGGFRFAGHAAMQDGSFEPAETALLQKLMRDTDVFVDVGANLGYYACLARAAGLKVVAIEPLASNLEYLLANLRENGWDDVEVFPVALAGRPGLMNLYGGSTGASTIPDWAGASTVLRRTVPVNTLDNVLGERFAGQRLLLKVDVEGAELGVLDGARRTLALRPAPRWLVEICLTENHPQGINPDFQAVFEIFFRNGYEARSVEAGLRVVSARDVASWAASRHREFGYVSYLFEARA